MDTARRLLVVAALGAVFGCASHVPPETLASARRTLPVAPVIDVQAPVVTLQADPIAALIGQAEQEFATGQSELNLGHLTAGRQHFDRAVDLLTASPAGARADARLDEEFEQLLDRINALETLAFHDGDGFSESRSEPAVIDELLAEGTFERPTPTTTTTETVEADIAHTPHDLPITVNDKVLSYIELFQGNLRSFMEDGLQRGAKYLPMIQEVFKAEGLPLDLAYVPLIESAFKPNALSRAAAKGIWQFEADTAKDYGLTENWFVDERSDPEKATHAAAEHLKMLRDLFGGDWNLTLASYNAGQGRVLTAMKRAKIDDYWQLSASSRFLPRDTREYVPMILAAIIIARNPAMYGFEPMPVEPLAFETVSVPDALDLRVLAEWTGVSVDEVRGLNPELRRGMTPLGTHDVKVPLGTAATVEARLTNADPSIFASSQFQSYVVKKGETLASIARRFHVSGGSKTLVSINSLRSSKVQLGQEIKIPREITTALASRPTAQNLSSRANGPSGHSATYRVKHGDTLSSIARQFDTTVQNLKRLNQLSNDVIVVGDKLTVRR